MKFNTIEEALAYIKTLEGEKRVLEGRATTAETALEKALKAQKDAETIANDALAKLTIAEDAIPKKLTAKISGKTYEVLFGVDGKTKEELAEDKDKLAILAKSGSMAIKLIEG